MAYNTQGNLITREATAESLCRGTTNPAATITCFQSATLANNNWQAAIAACSAQSGVTAPFTAVGAQAVNQVEFGMDGHKLGVYRSVKTGKWLEIHADGTPAFSFNEVRRDDKDIYLLDPARGVSIQLDLGKHQVFYSDGDAPTPRLLYNIRAASGPTATPGAVSVARSDPGFGAPKAKPQPQSATLAGSGQVDTSFAVLRCGAVTDANDAGNKCAAACSNYQGFSGNWAVAVQPNLATCQCKAKLDPKMKANEAISTLIKTNDDAARACPVACQYYGGGDGTWRDRDATHSICGCTEALH